MHLFEHRTQSYRLIFVARSHLIECNFPIHLDQNCVFSIDLNYQLSQVSDTSFDFILYHSDVLQPGQRVALVGRLDFIILIER